MITTMTHLKACGHRSLLPFQKGLIISSKSLSDLYAMLKVKYEISFLPTYKIKLDVVKDFLPPLFN